MMTKNKRRIAVVTGSRAEYGLMKSVLQHLQESKEVELLLIVTGMHLSAQFGSTYREIQKDGFRIAKKVVMLSSGDSSADIAQSIGRGVIGFSQALSALKPDLVVIVGDRFEMLSATTAAMALRLPIAHIGGGEATIGAMDDAIRHAITKMSHFHLCSNPKAQERVIQMGEQKNRVFYVGALGLDDLNSSQLLSKTELYCDLNLDLNQDVALVTFHPLSLEKESVSKDVLKNLCQALDSYQGNIIWTGSNADAQGRVLLKMIKQYTMRNKKTQLILSLGRLRYLSLMKYAQVMIGNSSSGIWEAPSFKLPVVNIGDRQKGRLRAKNVIDVGTSLRDIQAGIKEALSSRFRSSLKGLQNPYYKANASAHIAKILRTVTINQDILKKGFNEQ